MSWKKLFHQTSNNPADSILILEISNLENEIEANKQKQKNKNKHTNIFGMWFISGIQMRELESPNV